MKTQKEMRKAITAWMLGLPDRQVEAGSYITKVGREYVRGYYTYDGCKNWSEPIDYFYENNKMKIEK